MPVNLINPVGGSAALGRLPALDLSGGLGSAIGSGMAGAGSDIGEAIKQVILTKYRGQQELDILDKSQAFQRAIAEMQLAANKEVQGTFSARADLEERLQQGRQEHETTIAGMNKDLALAIEKSRREGDSESRELQAAMAGIQSAMGALGILSTENLARLNISANTQGQLIGHALTGVQQAQQLSTAREGEAKKVEQTKEQSPYRQLQEAMGRIVEPFGIQVAEGRRVSGGPNESLKSLVESTKWSSFDWDQKSRTIQKFTNGLREGFAEIDSLNLPNDVKNGAKSQVYNWVLQKVNSPATEDFEVKQGFWNYTSGKDAAKNALKELVNEGVVDPSQSLDLTNIFASQLQQINQRVMTANNPDLIKQALATHDAVSSVMSQRYPQITGEAPKTSISDLKNLIRANLDVLNKNPSTSGKFADLSGVLDEIQEPAAPLNTSTLGPQIAPTTPSFMLPPEFMGAIQELGPGSDMFDFAPVYNR